jgi:DNA-3-methyladenine glycosylase II
VRSRLRPRSHPPDPRPPTLDVDVDACGWPDVGRRDPVIADAQERLPGLRPCGFHSPYEAAAWAVLSRRLRIVQAARLL